MAVEQKTPSETPKEIRIRRGGLAWYTLLPPLVVFLTAPFLSQLLQTARDPLIQQYISTSWVLLMFAVAFYCTDKIVDMHVPKHDSFRIPSTAVGAVTAIQTLLGVSASVGLATFLSNPHDSSTALGIVTLMVSLLWAFLMISIRFEAFCYFYYVYQIRRKSEKK